LWINAVRKKDLAMSELFSGICRDQFPALRREENGRPVVYLDGPAGTQVPQTVIDAISQYLGNRNANHQGLFATSRESDEMLAEAHQAFADLLGVDDPGETIFGPNMTTLTFSLSRALGKTWNQGDEVIVTRLDHDANVAPWVLAARDAGATVHYVDIHSEDCTLDLEDFQSKLSSRTRMVAVGCSSNGSGTINPVRQICSWAHDVGSLVFLDAVHHAPHQLIDVAELDCDFLACSAYKFFGPHIGILWGRRELLESLQAYKVRPASNQLPDKWMTGTQNHACIAGALAAVDYLADTGRQLDGQDGLDRRAALEIAFAAIEPYEQQLTVQLLSGLAEMENYSVHGITDLQRMDERVPTVAITHREIATSELARRLGEQGIFSWHGNYYALLLTESLGLEPEGMLRVGMVHYNTADEVDRLLAELARMDK
jgi:cysteine desulfurase family protein (TIGR01976 family)